MSAIIRNPRDFWSGVIFAAFGLAGVAIGQDYSMGTAGRMGPGYFPSILGGILTVIGLVSVVRSMLRSGDYVGKFVSKDVLLVLTSTVLFGVLVRNAGLVLAIVVLVMVSGFASVKFKVGPFLAVAVGLAIFAVLVFVKGLGLPMPMFGPWLGF